MNKIKIIDLLNKIANGEEVPKKIKYRGEIAEYDEELFDYWIENLFKNTGYLFEGIFVNYGNKLNDEVEIIEEEKEIEFEDIETFGIHYSWDYIDYKDIEELKKYVNKDFQNIFDTLDKLIKNQKKIIDVINDMRDKE